MAPKCDMVVKKLISSGLLYFFSIINSHFLSFYKAKIVQGPFFLHLPMHIQDLGSFFYPWHFSVIKNNGRKDWPFFSLSIYDHHWKPNQSHVDSKSGVQLLSPKQLYPTLVKESGWLSPCSLWWGSHPCWTPPDSTLWLWFAFQW